MRFSLLVAPEWISLTSSNHTHTDLSIPASKPLTKEPFHLGPRDADERQRFGWVLMRFCQGHEGSAHGIKDSIPQPPRPILDI